RLHGDDEHDVSSSWASRSASGAIVSSIPQKASRPDRPGHSPRQVVAGNGRNRDHRHAVRTAEKGLSAPAGRWPWHARGGGATRFGGLLFLAALIGMTTSLTGPFLPIFVTRSLHASPSQLGAFLFVTAGAAVGVNVVFGLASDRGVS